MSATVERIPELQRKARRTTRWIAVLTVFVVIVAAIAIYAQVTATVAAKDAAHAACIGSNDAKKAVRDLVATLVDRAEAPIVNGTPEQLQRQADSVRAYKLALSDSQHLLADKRCDE